jgi:hypothetical protein
MAQPRLHTERLGLVPLADEHLAFEIELDSDPEVMRYITGRALSPVEVERAHRRRLAAAHEVPGLGSGRVLRTTISSAGGFFVRRTDRISRESPARPISATGCCDGTGAMDTPVRARDG